MAAAWKVYNLAKKYIGDGTIDLDAATLRMSLHKSTSNASTFTLSTLASITNVVDAAGYNGPKTITASVVVGASAAAYKFTFTSIIYTASGADITSIMYAVIAVSGGKAICWSQLSIGAFSVTSTNTLTIGADATGGAFTITGGTT